MSERRERRTIDNLSGVGKVTQNGEEIATVSYDLEVTQEFIIIRSHSGTQEVPALKNIRGSLFSISGEAIPLTRDLYTLILQDQRELDCILTPRSGGSYAFSGSGDIRDTDTYTHRGIRAR